MIDRTGSELELVCDATGERYARTYDADEFMKMIADAKEDGWLVTVQKGEWRHYSPAAQSVADDFVDIDGID